jgi:RHS repeat-associated protein
VYFYDVTGELLGEYSVLVDGEGKLYPKQERMRVSFAGRPLEWEDRLGSKVIGPIDQQTGQATRYRYYPYGQNIGTNVGWDDVQFATYTRDGATGLDYARNRYYTRTWGRFLSPGPGPADPKIAGSWNPYSYAWNDPANLNDPDGLLPAGPGSFLPQPPNGPVYGVADWFWWGSGSIVIGGWGTLTQTHQLWRAVEALESIGSDVRPSTGGYQISVEAELFNFMVEAGTISIGAGGAASLGGIAIGVDWAAAGAAVGAILTNPVTITVAAGAVAIGGVAWWMARRKADLDQFDEAMRRYERKCGKSLSRDQRRTVHDQLRKTGPHEIDDIVGIAEALFGCPKEHGQ